MTNDEIRMTNEINNDQPGGQGYFFTAWGSLPAGLRAAVVQAWVRRSPAVWTICSRLAPLMRSAATAGVMGPS